MAILKKENDDNKRTMKRLKYCVKCKEYTYHIYFLEYPARIFICQDCKYELKSYSTK